MVDRRFFDFNYIIHSIANYPSSNPTVGTQYIVGINPVNEFANAITNYIARYENSNWIFIPPKNGEEVFNIATDEIIKYDGTNWITVFSSNRTVLDIVKTGSTLPSSATIGDKFLNINNAKLYTATATNTWNNGIITSKGNKYASSTDCNIYLSNGSICTALPINDGHLFFNRNDNKLYVYIAQNNKFTVISSSSSGGIVIYNEEHILTEYEISNKSFSLTFNITSLNIENTKIIFQGLVFLPNIDFSVSGNIISWEDYENSFLHKLIAGDTVYIQYVRA